MDIYIQHAFLPAVDFEASLAFYRDALGFEVRKDVGYGDMRWITLGQPTGEHTTLVLQPPAADPGLTDDEKRTIDEMIAKGSYGFLVLSTTDLQAAFDKVAATGAEVAQEPMDQPYGVRDCAFRDPAGNMVRINQLEV
ncbi:VOC family protein [Tsukamurella sp. 1534]|uniref:VOC family protein n=1 Tax=Tsukamurella sp. 1534 TaxID=1151061 RepID=UPI00031F7261|nr:VOC family protein [Tsukamurella sp. 1534]